MKGRIKARSLNVTIAARSQPTGVELVDTTSVGRQCVAMASNVTIAARWLQGRRYAEFVGNEIWPQWLNCDDRFVLPAWTQVCRNRRERNLAATQGSAYK